jgi:D-tyrosyl-tRNA(Tyr) deacylase
LRVLLQRVARASVTVQGLEIANIGKGLVLLVGVSKEDCEDDAKYLTEKVLNLRIFPDAAGRFNCSALETRAELLIVSQFTLYAGTRKGRRPDFIEAALPQDAQILYDQAVQLFRGSGLRVETGRFGEHMQVDLQNDGPVTLMLDSADRSRPRRS